jgi:uncharacterized lipoprotein YajG
LKENIMRLVLPLAALALLAACSSSEDTSALAPKSASAPVLAKADTSAESSVAR